MYQSKTYTCRNVTWMLSHSSWDLKIQSFLSCSSSCFLTISKPTVPRCFFLSRKAPGTIFIFPLYLVERDEAHGVLLSMQHECWPAFPSCRILSGESGWLSVSLTRVRAERKADIERLCAITLPHFPRFSPKLCGTQSGRDQGPSSGYLRVAVSSTSPQMLPSDTPAPR